MCDVCLTDLEEKRGENATCAGDTQLRQVVKCQATGDKLRESLSRLCEWARELPRMHRCGQVQGAAFGKNNRAILRGWERVEQD